MSTHLLRKFKKVARQFSYLPRTLRLVWDATRWRMLLWLLFLLVQALLPVGTIYLTRILVDNLAVALGAGLSWEALSPVFWPAAFMALIWILNDASQSLLLWINTAQAERVQDHVSRLIHDKAVSIDLAYYETPEYFDRLSRATGEAIQRPLALLQSCGALLQNSLTFIAMVGLLLPYGVLLPLALVISTFPAFYIVLRHNLRYHSWWQAVTANRRWTDYYNRLLTDRIAAPEIRLFDLGKHFQTAYQEVRQRLREQRIQLLKQYSLNRLGIGVVALLAAVGAFAWVGMRALNGELSLGDLALFYQAFEKGRGLMRVLLGDVSELYANSLYLEELFDYLTLTPQVTDPPAPTQVTFNLKQSIQFRDVTFRYPGAEESTLDHFNLTIPAGKMTAIVGTNGAGKSTLIKLLCRFYDPMEGAVEVDGVDLRHFNLAELRRQITILFQQPVAYTATARQSITLGDLHAHHSDERVAAAARNAGADEVIAQLPLGYETLLGKSFEQGTELSGGEWQRMALARAFYRSAPILILDEPTSAMDSWAEIKWLDRLEKLAVGRTTFIITHRLTTAMRADHIYVMDRGAIVESGSHEELLAQGGLYAFSWTAQTRADSAQTRSMRAAEWPNGVEPYNSLGATVPS